MSTHSRLALAAAIILGASAAHAELLVVDQKGTGYTVKQTLSDGASLNVPEGAFLKLRRLPDGVEVRVEGPHNNPLSKYHAKGGCQWWNLACTKDKPEPGVTRGVEPSAGATRGIE